MELSLANTSFDHVQLIFFQVKLTEARANERAADVLLSSQESRLSDSSYCHVRAVVEVSRILEYMHC